MKLILLASWITALHTYPQSTSGYNYSASSGSGGGLSAHSPSGCSSDDTKGSCHSASNAEGYPSRKEPDTTAGSGESQFAGYSGQMESEQNEIASSGSGGDIQFGGYPSDPNQTGPSTVPQDEPKVQVQKHIYFHVAPPEPAIEQQKQPMTAGARQRHYTIIFIDTSRYSAPPRQQQQMAAAQNEEKTIVYVLVKKPEEQGDAAVLTGPMAPPNKPEVFFIKYKQQRESKPETPQTMDRDQPKQEDNRDQYLPPKMV